MTERTTGYWRILLRFGLPFVVLFQLADYLIFGRNALSGNHSWWLSLAIDIPVLFSVSALFYTWINSRKKAN